MTKMSTRQIEVHIEHLMDQTTALVEYDAKADLFKLDCLDGTYAAKWFSADNWDIYYQEIRDDKSVRVKWHDSTRVWQTALSFTHAMETWESNDYPLFGIVPELDRRGILRGVNMGSTGNKVHLFLDIENMFDSVIAAWVEGSYVTGEYFTEDYQISFPRWAATPRGVANQLQYLSEECAVSE